MGLGRCGIQPDDTEALLALCVSIGDAPYLTLRGLYSHAGHAYGCTDKAGLVAVASRERAVMHHLRSLLLSGAVDPPGSVVLSFGSTPSACVMDETCSMGLPPLEDQEVECTAGNYVCAMRCNTMRVWGWVGNERGRQLACGNVLVLVIYFHTMVVGVHAGTSVCFFIYIFVLRCWLVHMRSRSDSPFPQKPLPPILPPTPVSSSSC